VIDEIRTQKEAAAAKQIAQRGLIDSKETHYDLTHHSQPGVSMVATAHGISLTTLLKDPALVPLVGGNQQTVI